MFIITSLFSAVRAPYKKSRAIYWFRCSRLDCDEESNGESSRTFAERYKEHLKAPSPILEQKSSTDHKTTLVYYS